MNELFSPVEIGGVGRIVMPPMTTRLADDEGRVTEDLIAYYEARARGGFGLITYRAANQAGKAGDAIDDAFRAALLRQRPTKAVSREQPGCSARAIAC